MQQDVLPAKAFGQGKSSAIHVSRFPVCRVVLVHDTRKSRLYRERHKNGFRECRGATLIVVVDCRALEVTPNAVQVHPVLSLHRRTRIFLPCIVFCQLFTPNGHDWSRLLRPYTLCTGASRKGQHGSHNCYHATTNCIFHNLYLFCLLNCDLLAANDVDALL